MFDTKQIQEAFIDKLQTMTGKPLSEATDFDKYVALSYIVRDQISRNLIETKQQYKEENTKQIYYFSMEFLLGSLLDCNLINMGSKQLYTKALSDLGINIDDLLHQEHDAGLGNGGLGRLAACFLDSMASLGIAGHGCGIRYKYGLFKQRIVDGTQVELPDEWLRDGYLWEFRNPHRVVEVKFAGKVIPEMQNGKLKFKYEDYIPVRAVPYDVPIVGYHNDKVNILRLWSSEPVHFNLDDTPSIAYNDSNDYIKALEQKHYIEGISRILYPDDTLYEGKMLRLTQQYFFVSAGIQSIISKHLRRGNKIKCLHEKVSIHINDTHPALAVPELMRILLDEHELSWDEAWNITTKTISYTNHTILPEALETWGVDMFQKVLPRNYMIVEEINRRLQEEILNKTHDPNLLSSMSIISDNRVHMARLSVVGSHSVNGVAKLHTEILRNHVMANFDKFYPGKFNNKTNGITHRRWIIKSNPELSDLIDNTITSQWRSNPQLLEQLLKFADNKTFQDSIDKVKLGNKKRLADYIQKHQNISVDPNSIFDIQIKRIHSYKRQLLNIIHIMSLYNKLRENPDMDIIPRTFIFAGKAAPGYYIAKQTIRLINAVANKVNADKSIKNKLKVIFLENYSVSLGEILFPAADVSEQISTASKEASGTGNMKFMLNGAVTIGTMDGANVEIHEAVGDDNIIIFGMRSDEVMSLYQNKTYNAWDTYNSVPELKIALDQLVNGFYGRQDEFKELYDYLLLHNDEFFILKDFEAYAQAQIRVNDLYKNRKKWLHTCIVNIAKAGIFASDRTIKEYANEIWGVEHQ